MRIVALLSRGAKTPKKRARPAIIDKIFYWDSKAFGTPEKSHKKSSILPYCTQMGIVVNCKNQFILFDAWFLYM
jgi:hypothetical protein